MSSIIETAVECTCTNWSGTLEVRQCPIHFHIFRGQTRLTSVGRIVAASFPLDPSVPASVLENARDRGSEVDKLAAAYVLGKLDRIPAGTRTDSRDLFMKFRTWFDDQNFSKVEAQILLAGDDYGGVLDFRFNDRPYDLKCTYNVEHSARLQVAGYESLIGRDGFIVHVTERFPTPKVVPIEGEDRYDWGICLEFYRMKQRRSKGKIDND